MSDLISRKATIQRFIQETEESGKNVIHINTIKRILQDIDTAYDVEKVVEEIRKSSGNGYRDIDGDYVPPMIETKDAIEIVRKGGAT